MGAANIAAGFFQGFAVSTSGSRTAVAEQSGAKSQVTGVVGAALVAVLLLFLNSLLADLPQTRAGRGGDRRRAVADGPRHPAPLLASPQERPRGVARRDGRRDAARRAAGHRRRGRARDPAVLPAQLVASRRGPRQGRGRSRDGTTSTPIRTPRQIPGVVVYRWEAPLFFANAGSFRAADPQARARTTSPMGGPAVRGRHRRRRHRRRDARAARQRAQRGRDAHGVRRDAQPPAGAHAALRPPGDARSRSLLPDARGRSRGDPSRGCPAPPEAQPPVRRGAQSRCQSLRSCSNGSSSALGACASSRPFVSSSASRCCLVTAGSGGRSPSACEPAPRPLRPGRTTCGRRGSRTTAPTRCSCARASRRTRSGSHPSARAL